MSVLIVDSAELRRAAGTFRGAARRLAEAREQLSRAEQLLAADPGAQAIAVDLVTVVAVFERQRHLLEQFDRYLQAQALRVELAESHAAAALNRGILGTFPLQMTVREILDVATRALEGAIEVVLPPFMRRAAGGERGGYEWAAIALALVSGTRLSPVSVRPGAVTAATAPRSLEELVRRVPNGGDGSPQMRIEHYAVDGGAEYVVYLGGTRADPEGTEPFDMGGNLGAVGGISTAALRASHLALERAEIPTGATVHFVGYSQGALLAARLSQSSRYTVGSTVLIGSPADAIVPRRNVPGVVLQHHDDLIPGLAGPGGARRAGPPHVVGPAPVIARGPGPLGAHALEAYAESAAERDRAQRASGAPGTMSPVWERWHPTGEAQEVRLIEHPRMRDVSCDDEIPGVAESHRESR